MATAIARLADTRAMGTGRFQVISPAGRLARGLMPNAGARWYRLTVWTMERWAADRGQRAGRAISGGLYTG